MKYAFIQRHRQVWPITVQCRVLRASVSGYHAHVARQASIAPRRFLSDAALLVHIKAVHRQSCGGYGRPRLWRELRNDGVRVGKQRLQTLMQKHGIRAKGKKRFKVATDSHHDLPIAPNLLNRQFTVAARGKVWVGDITYIPTDEGWLFLAVVIDLIQSSGGGLVDARGHDTRHCHRRAAHSVVQAPPVPWDHRTQPG